MYVELSGTETTHARNIPALSEQSQQQQNNNTISYGINAKREVEKILGINWCGTAT